MLTHRSASRSRPNTANGRQEVDADLGRRQRRLHSHGNGGLGSADYAVRGMTGYGASLPLPSVSTKVRLLNRLPTLDLGVGITLHVRGRGKTHLQSTAGRPAVLLSAWQAVGRSYQGRLRPSNPTIGVKPIFSPVPIADIW